MRNVKSVEKGEARHEHTPGPWRVGRRTEASYEPFVVFRKDSVEVCEVRRVWEDDGEADATLIAAAPDLLEALKALRSLLQSENVRIEAKDVDWFVADSIYEKADAAIDKALTPTNNSKRREVDG